MKTRSLIELSLLCFLCTGTASGQSSIFALSNEPFTGVDAPVFDAEGNPLGSDYLAELWGAATPDSLVPAYDLRSGTRLILPFADMPAGYFNSSESLIVPAQITHYSWLQVRAWDSRLGPTYEAVAALDIGGYGESALFYAHGAAPYDMLAFPAPLIGLESFSLRPVVPEPSTWVLLATGGVLLWMGVRRRKRP